MGVIELTGFGDLLRLVGILFWVLVIVALILALALPKTRNGKARALLSDGRAYRLHDGSRPRQRLGRQIAVAFCGRSRVSNISDLEQACLPNRSNS